MMAAAMDLGCREYLHLVDSTTFATLSRLNELPRSDPFWSANNRRPTVGKLPSFCATLLAGNPTDVQARLTLAVLDTFYGANGFGEEHWRRLISVGAMEPRWSILAGLWNEVALGFGPAPLAHFIAEASILDAARKALQPLLESGCSALSIWATDVIATATSLSATRRAR